MINVGDFILGKDEIWEIVKTYKSGVDTLYDLKRISEPGDFLEIYNYDLAEYKGADPGDGLKSVTLSYIRHLGQVVPKDSQKAIEILFGKPE